MVQAKLAIGASNDPLEIEADRVANEVLTGRSTPIGSGAAMEVHRATSSGPTGGKSAPPSVERALAGPGRPLEPELRQDMEVRFGHDFSRVRVHSDGTAERSAREINAHAYTVGRDIVFGAGRFAPRTQVGRRLLAHELTHVIQQATDGELGMDRSRGIGSSPVIVARTSRNKVMREGFESTFKVCQRVLPPKRRFQVTKGGLRVVMVMGGLDKAIPDCRDFQFGVTLTRERDWGFDDEIGTCTASTGGTRTFLFGNLPAGTYYLTIWRTFDHPYCCLEGDILVFDEPVRADSSGCERDKDPSAMDIVHGALDLAGFIPVLGAIPDGINAGIYVAEGDWANAGLSAIAMVPAWGDGVKLTSMAGKSAVRLTEKAAIRLGEGGIAKGLKEVKAASKVEKAVVEGAEEVGKVAKVEAEAAGGVVKGEAKAATQAEKEVGEKAARKAEKEAAERLLEKRIKECLEIYAAKEALGTCRGCKGTDTPSERAAKIACLMAEVAARQKYLDEKCDDVLPGSITRKSKGQDPEGGHRDQLKGKIAALAKCYTLPTS